MRLRRTNPRLFLLVTALALLGASFDRAALAASLDRAALAANPALIASQSLIKRVMPEYANRFAIEIIPRDRGRDVFEIESREGKITLRGNNPVAVASAFNWYLKHYANCHYSWCGDQLHLPDPLPVVRRKVRIVNPSQYRVFFNYCTLSYSATWWDWKRWEREIAFMALNGYR